ncbi:hypothetical protein ACFL2X_06855 [Candidatus Latescibacterota bacterium]
MIYSESRPDTDILNDLEEAQRVYILGCPACANMSLNIQKAEETTPVLSITPTGLKAVSMKEETDRLTQLISNKGLDANSWVGKYPIVALCVMDKRARKGISKKCQDFDTVITMCCEAGKKSIEGILPGKRVIAGMNAKGIVDAVIKSKMVFAKLYIDKSTVNVSRFTFDA